jgi:diguanylate cyclase (GGDEF)-like protein/PAS domain S-box-containing protein
MSVMFNKTRSQLEAEILELTARLAAREARPVGRGDDTAVVSQGTLVERKSTNENLKSSEVRYRRLFETAKDGILILDAETGRITDSNPFLEQMLGYTHAETLGKHLWEIGPFRDIDASRLSFEQLQNNEYVRYENLPLETKAGERRQVEFVSNVYLVDKIKVIQCNIRDITQRKEAEARVQEANEKLSTLVAALQRREFEMGLLNSYNDLLQTCETQDEAYRVIAILAGKLFPTQSGCLAVFHPSMRSLETVARWGEENLVEDVFALEDCWAIRRGQVHEVADPATALLCKHFVRPPELGYLCLPLMVHGETLGVLHLSASSSGGGPDRFAERQLATMVGESIKLCMANLQLRERLHEQATRDPLTGLYNRRYLSDTLPRELHHALRRKVPLSVAMIDLDNCKRFNDTFGHDAGDLVLRESAHMFQERLRKSDIACRYGGEEFVLVLADSGLEDARQRLDRIRGLFERSQLYHEGKLLGRMTFSGGIAAAPEHGITAEELLRAADEAVYSAKQAGRNCLVNFRPRE